MSLRTLLDDAKRKILLDTLEANNGNMTLAAKQLDIHRTSLYKMLKELNAFQPKQTNKGNAAWQDLRN